MNTDLLIVGGGPAGLNAAYKACSNGIQTTIVDECLTLGGQLNSQTQLYQNLPQDFSTQRGFEFAHSLVHRLKKLDLTILTDHKMIGAYQDGNIGVATENKTFPIYAKKIIISTGAAEELEIFSGWTLPGVMTAGAAQILMNEERVLPGKEAFILGSNDFALSVACQLKDCGINVKGIIEKGPEIICQSNKLVERLRIYDIPILLNSFIEQAQGNDEVEEVCINIDGREYFYNVDLICIAKGMTPIIDPFEIMNCELTYQEKLGGWIPKYDYTLQTTNPSVYIAGNAAGMTSMAGVLLTGEMAALSVMEVLNIVDSQEIERQRKYLWENLCLFESKENRDALDARLNLIQAFHHEMGNQMPTYLEGVYRGLTHE